MLSNPHAIAETQEWRRCTKVGCPVGSTARLLACSLSVDDLVDVLEPTFSVVSLIDKAADVGMSFDRACREEGEVGGVSRASRAMSEDHVDCEGVAKDVDSTIDTHQCA